MNKSKIFLWLFLLLPGYLVVNVYSAENLSSKVDDILSEKHFGRATELIEMGDKAFSTYKQILENNPSPMTIKRIVGVLGYLPFDRSMFSPKVIEILKTHDDKWVKIYCIELLGKIGDEKHHHILLEMLKVKDEQIRINSIRAFAKLANQKTIGKLNPYILELKKELSPEQIKADLTFKEADRAILKIKERSAALALLPEIDIIDTSSPLRLIETIALAIQTNNYSFFQSCLSGDTLKLYPTPDKDSKGFSDARFNKASAAFAQKYEGALIDSIEVKRHNQGQAIGIIKASRDNAREKDELVLVLSLSKVQSEWRVTNIKNEKNIK